MAEENLDNQEGNPPVDASKINVNNEEKPQEVDIETLVAERVAEALKPLKSNLDSAYNARDEALKQLAEKEAREKEQELARLQEEGKHKEAYELQLAEEKARIKVLEENNIKLTRDITVRNALAGLDFRNERANDMAFKEIVEQLIKTENGTWIHKDGTPIENFVKSFADSEDNAFLFKQKVSTGGGIDAINTNKSGTTSGSLFDKSQDEVLKMAAEGKLPGR